MPGIGFDTARRRALAATASLLLFGAISDNALLAQAAAPAPGQAPGDEPPPALEATVDTTVRPGDDFFGYANGRWLKATAIPAGRDRWSVRDEINALTRRQVAAILDDARSAAPGTLARKVADFRAAYLDRAAIERRGVAPLAPALARIARVKDKAALAQLLGATMRADADPLNSPVSASASPLGLSVEHGVHGERRYTAFLVQGGLGLGDREAYLSGGAKAAARRERYRKYVARALALAGFDRPAPRADSVLALETAIAGTQATAEASADDRNVEHAWTRAVLAREAPGMEWGAFLEAAGLGAEQTIVAWQPSAVRGVAALVGARSLEAWKDYLRFRAIDERAEVLPRAFADAAAAAREDRRTPEERATAVTESALADLIGELYAKRYFPPAQKARVRGIIANVAAAFREHVARAAWLSPASRETALAKLDALYVGIGYPEAWQDWSDLRIAPGDAFGNAERVAERERRRALARLAAPYDPHEWVLPPHTAGAVLVFQQNAYEFAAALLQPPKYDSTASDAAAYGAIGAIIGHDVSHFVDVLGAYYRPDGATGRWWTAEDSARFDAAAEPIVRQFGAYEALPGVHVDGKLTRTENVADLAGLTAAFEAYRKSLGARSADRSYVRREDREFFIAFAQAFRARLGEPALRAQLATDHAPETFRTSTVRNLDAWNDAFGVVPGERLYLEPGARVRIW
jgi:predicted metalloendopeptidase